MLGRGTFKGSTLDENGQPLKDTAVRITSLTDSSSYGATSDAEGRFTVARVPVGNIFIEAVNTPRNAQFSSARASRSPARRRRRDLVLLTADSPKQITIKRAP